MGSSHVIVSGSSGFIGTKLCERLQQEGVALIRVPHFELLKLHCDVDIRSKWHDILRGKKPSHFIHLAWNVNASAWKNTPSQENLIKGTLALLEMGDSLQYVLATGTSQEYLPKTYALDENSDLSFDCQYLMDKHLMHEEMRKYTLKRGIAFGWVRLFNVYGPGDHPSRVLSSLIKSYKKGEIFKLRNPDYALDLVHVEDVVEGILHLMSIRGNGIFNLGSGVPVTPHAIAGYLAYLNSFPPSDTSREIPKAGNKRGRFADASKLKRYGWSPTKILEEEVYDMFKSSDN
jgi:nucleoside-diphosphate-sugar epimerase